MLYKTMTAAALAAVLATPAFAQSSQMDRPKTDTMQQHQSATPKADKGTTTGQNSMDKSSGAMDKSPDDKASSSGLMDKNAATDRDSSMDKKSADKQDKAGSMTKTSAAEKRPGFVQSPEAGEWRASKLIGASVVGPDDKSIGDINELLIADDGGVDAVVVGVGGFLGIGEKNVAIPFDALNVQRKADSDAIEKITVSYSKEELENAPKFAYNKEQPKPATTGANPGGMPLGAKPATPSQENKK
jgi:ribosomal 30S subunit maturation factor RimM